MTCRVEGHGRATDQARQPAVNNLEPHARGTGTEYYQTADSIPGPARTALAWLNLGSKSMFQLGSRLFLVGLLGSSLGVVASCAAGSSPTSTFGRDATSDVSSSDDGPSGGDSTAPIALGDDGAGRNGDACAADGCDGSAGFCGDGMVQPPESCDDNNSTPGDGCSGTCQIETGWACPVAGQPCVKIWVCGNGQVDPGEECDDGNTNAGDGCSPSCGVEAGYSCPNHYGNQACLSSTGVACCPNIAAAGKSCVGGACTKLVVNVCGDGALAGTEQCDDGDTNSGDGCSSTCQLEQGWTCPQPGKPCKRIEYCGNRILELDIGEQCDDGNMVSGDGCGTTCQVEPGFICPAPGQACVSTIVCGDGRLDGNEQCDSGHFNGSDGCTSACTLVRGWRCPTPGAACITVCGDGIVAGNEQCDMGALNGTGAGCNATCSVDTGFACVASTPPPGADAGADAGSDGAAPPQSVCHKTVCGDGIVDGTEQCDDGNLIAYDGCSPTCTIEPKCNGQGQCTAICGDGLVEPPEQCDIGALNGRRQGCGPTCQNEPSDGWYCAPELQPPPPTLVIPILYRDMTYWNTGMAGGPPLPVPGPVAGHPDFNCPPGFCGPDTVSPGEVQPQLGADGKPVFAFMGNPRTITDATSFCWWYHDTGCGAGGANPYAKLVYLDLGGNPTTLTLAQGVSGTYTYNNQQFFPLDALGWNAGANPQLDTDCESQFTGGAVSAPRNFSFTSELHYVFTYRASVAASATPAVFNFTGDDDVWGFINNRLVIDLGGVHSPASASYTLNTTNAGSLGLVDGGWYSIDLFQSEAHVCRSTYALTLSNFDHIVTKCTRVCGDGIVEGPEQCDPGPSGGDAGISDAGAGDGAAADASAAGVYGGCNPDCTLGPYCGDGIVQKPPEQCDDGLNLVTYGGTTKQCGPGCKWAPYCGDGIVSNGEQCDNGVGNVPLANGPYGSGICTAACTIAPHCGDGIVQSANGEQCDDGPSNGSSGSNCDANCKVKCGNGALDPGEQCDNGTKNVDPATMPYGPGMCTTACRFAPYCGDGILQNPPEQCDYGTAGNAGSYGGCNLDCTLGPYCGDGVVQNPPEQCDNGMNNVVPAAAYGSGMCTTACVAAPYCGDGIVEAQFGEQCDGTADCNSMCRFLVPK
jgi:fibro-slime domain-containing protein